MIPPIRLHIPDDAPLTAFLIAVTRVADQLGYRYTFDGGAIRVTERHQAPSIDYAQHPKVTPFRRATDA